jgi:hypothetical protein
MPDRLHHVIEGGGACEPFMSSQLRALSSYAFRLFALSFEPSASFSFQLSALSSYAFSYHLSANMLFTMSPITLTRSQERMIETHKGIDVPIVNQFP